MFGILLFVEFQSLQATVRKQGKISSIPQGNKWGKSNKNGRTINGGFFCCHILVKKISSILHIRKASSFSNQLHMTAQFFFFFSWNTIFYVYEPNLAACFRKSWQLCPHCCLPRAWLAAKAAQGSWGQLLRAVKMLCSSVTLCTTDVIALFAVREIYPQNTGLCHDCCKLTWWLQRWSTSCHITVRVIHPL